MWSLITVYRSINSNCHPLETQIFFVCFTFLWKSKHSILLTTKPTLWSYSFWKCIMFFHLLQVLTDLLTSISSELHVLCLSVWMYVSITHTEAETDGQTQRVRETETEVGKERQRESYLLEPLPGDQAVKSMTLWGHCYSNCQGSLSHLYSVQDPSSWNDHINSRHRSPHFHLPILHDSSQRCPEYWLLGYPRFCKVDNINHHSLWQMPQNLVQGKYS